MNTQLFKSIVCTEKKDKFTNCNLSSISSDGRLIAVNDKFLAMSHKNKGEIVVVDSSNPSIIKENSPCFKNNNGNVLDLEFSPFNNNLLVSSNDNNSVLLWNIPEGGLKQNITKEFNIYNKHKNKVFFVTFNPIVKEVLCSGTLGSEIHVWNLEKSDSYIELKSEDNPIMISWSPNGNLIGVSTKNKSINIFDPRKKEMILKKIINEGNIFAKFVWVDNNLFASTGWNKKRYANFLKLWDIRKINEEITSIELNKNNTMSSYPFINRKSKLIYIEGKDEPYIHLYNYNEEKIQKVTDYKCDESSHCTVLFNRKCFEDEKYEIDRFARYSQKSKKISFVSISLKQSQMFIESYLPKETKEITLTYERWIKGENIKSDENNNNTIKNESPKINDSQKEIKTEKKDIINQKKESQEIKLKEKNGNFGKTTKMSDFLNQNNAKPNPSGNSLSIFLAIFCNLPFIYSSSLSIFLSFHINNLLKLQ